MAAPRTRPAVSLWDPVVRLTHWGAAGIVLGNALISEGGSLIHVTLGWLLIALLLLRLVWGLFGPVEARFSAFPPRPMAALRHLRSLMAGKPRDYPTHNPAGALMAYALWATLAVLVVTGLVMTGGATPMQVADDTAAVASGDWSALIRETEGDSSGDTDDGLGDLAKEVHEMASNLLLLLAALHLAGVLLESRALKRNLVRPMVLGKRRK